MFSLFPPSHFFHSVAEHFLAVQSDLDALGEAHGDQLLLELQRGVIYALLNKIAVANLTSSGGGGGGSGGGGGGGNGNNQGPNGLDNVFNMTRDDGPVF